MFAAAASAGLMSVGCRVIDLGVVPTPTVQLAVTHHKAGAGLILTASHNPVEWNALKLLGPDGVFLDAAAGTAVRALADQGPPRAGWDGSARSPRTGTRSRVTSRRFSRFPRWMSGLSAAGNSMSPSIACGGQGVW